MDLVPRSLVLLLAAVVLTPATLASTAAADQYCSVNDGEPVSVQTRCWQFVPCPPDTPPGATCWQYCLVYIYTTGTGEVCKYQSVSVCVGSVCVPDAVRVLATLP